MIEKMALKIVNQMEKQKIISKSNCEYYEYALIAMVENAITVGTMLLLGMLLENSANDLFSAVLSFITETYRGISCG